MSEEMTEFEALDMVERSHSSHSRSELFQQAIKIIHKALKDKPKKWTEEDLRIFINDWFSDKNEFGGVSECVKYIFKRIGLLKEEPPKEPEYQWLYKLRGSNFWSGITAYMTEKIFQQYKCPNEYIYERIESSKR